MNPSNCLNCMYICMPMKQRLRLFHRRLDPHGSSTRMFCPSDASSLNVRLCDICPQKRINRSIISKTTQFGQKRRHKRMLDI